MAAHLFNCIGAAGNPYTHMHNALTAWPTVDAALDRRSILRRYNRKCIFQPIWKMKKINEIIISYPIEQMSLIRH